MVFTFANAKLNSTSLAVALCSAGLRAGSMFPACNRPWDSLADQESHEVLDVVQAALDDLMDQGALG